MWSAPFRLGRRLLRLHGGALANAEAAMHSDDAARRHRETIAAEIDSMATDAHESARPALVAARPHGSDS